MPPPVDTTFKVKRSRSPGRFTHRTATVSVGSYWAWETATTLRCARRRFGAHRGRRGVGAYRGSRPPTACYKKLSWCWQTCATRLRSPNIVPFHMLCLVSSCAIVTLSLRRAVFSDIRLQKWRDLENRVSGPSRSLEISSFDRAHTTF